jgi:hypothetical protein
LLASYLVLPSRNRLKKRILQYNTSFGKGSRSYRKKKGCFNETPFNVAY